MRILPMWEVGGVYKAIRKVSTMQTDEILQQRMPEERLGLPPPLVRCSNHRLNDQIITTRNSAERSASLDEHEFPNIITSHIRRSIIHTRANEQLD